MILDYLKKYAQKAYREIHTITTSPHFLFSNDPKLIQNEANYNYLYIHGFNRLIKNNRISSEKLIEAFSYLEEEIVEYLKKHYKDKEFIFYLNADALVPAFTMTLVSYYGDQDLKESSSLTELIDWYKENACFNGLEIIENETDEEQIESESEDILPIVAKRYIKLINT
ncbi:hypothetical protein [Saccharibacillus sp. JS10]|uniref:hypothetical protein n=1 Tax=Saccharibacillus sp. JS10 TaxID=2950552 RepID=UPI00210ED65D|nr:hypothetical protein [Saccharibacillus sp. JS10]MCQ4088452.1 hypothetical protein [Saccharibacillus sp. JS10]